MLPIQMFLRGCRKRLFSFKIADSSGISMTGGRLLAAALVMHRMLIRKGIVCSNHNMVGVLLPPSIGAVLANMGIGLSGGVAVNLNYAFSNQSISKCVSQCKISHVLTSRKFLAKRPLALEQEFVYVEDLIRDSTWFDRFMAGCKAYLLPSFLLERTLGLRSLDADDLMAVLFTSGTTGDPKGVMLSQRNIAASIDAIRILFRVDPQDVAIGILPFFHAFGYSATLWLPLALDMAVVYHFDPLGTQSIGDLARRFRATLLFATPSLLKLYVRRCKSEDLKCLDLAIVGAEKLDAKLAEQFSEKFGATPVEGYGTTELAPWATVNVPAHRSLAPHGTPQNKPGSVGRPLPYVEVQVVDRETKRELTNGQEGLLWVRGPNVMLGYLNQSEKTAAVIHDGWYDTGDIAKIDDEGFVTITGRQSRFSKIGGEMVPHEQVENLIAEIIRSDAKNDQPESVEPIVAVTAIADSNKEERLIVIHQPLLGMCPGDIVGRLAQMDVSKLWIPRPNDFIEVPSIPLTSIGKLDLAVVNRIAHANSNRAPTTVDVTT